MKEKKIHVTNTDTNKLFMMMMASSSSIIQNRPTTTNHHIFVNMSP